MLSFYLSEVPADKLILPLTSMNIVQCISV